jgi:hypothetical protein
VEVSRSRFEIFEQMHYVCFHYAFEHDPADPDEECTAGGCPSAAINPRPDHGNADVGLQERLLDAQQGAPLPVHALCLDLG